MAGGRPVCPFTSRCYRRNPHHFREYSHPHLATLLADHPSLLLPPTTPLPTSLTLATLAQQLAIYRDIEKGLQKTSDPATSIPSTQPSSPTMKTSSPTTKTSPSATKTSTTFKAARTNGTRTPAAPSPAADPAAAADDMFDDADDAELQEALRRSLEEQEEGGGARSRAEEGGGGGGSNKGVKRSRSPTPSSTQPSSKRNITSESLKNSIPSSTSSPITISTTSSPITTSTTSPPLSLIQRKLAAAEPYGFLLTKVQACPESQRDSYSIFLSDLLHPSLGTLASSLQINFMVELDFLTMCYEVHGVQGLPLVILHGCESPELASPPSHVRAVRVKPKYPYGTHHTKMMVLTYSCGGVRVVVHTANLVGSDWINRSQGLWVSPLCPRLAEGGGRGEATTGFKAALLRYLRFYEVSAVHQFVAALEGADMSGVKVAFVSSVPGSHRGEEMHLWGHRAVRRVLRSTSCSPSWPVVAQASSIGSLGPSPDTWLEGELGRSLGGRRVELVYPSLQDIEASYEGKAGGGCLPYGRRTAEKQPWLQGNMCRWAASASHRTRAPPHIKTYTQHQGSQLSYFLLTSANLSKAAWGSMNREGSSLLVMSYEAGVVWLPATWGREAFTSTPFRARAPGAPEFPLHYDLPTTPYTGDQRPWLMDYMMG